MMAAAEANPNPFVPFSRGNVTKMGSREKNLSPPFGKTCFFGSPLTKGAREIL
jgi:hypothetical protein